LAPTFVTHSERETAALARQLGASLVSGTTVLLYGDLGAGKTSFVRGLAEGLGVNPDEVTSPTFVLIQQYHGRALLVHVDLYRLEDPAAVDDLGLEELTQGNVVAIEWAERLPRPIPGAVHVTLADGGGNTRRITIEDVPRNEG
jgi:tRNA threonylcarbamoyladenosine biosynthesis protein TsaE